MRWSIRLGTVAGIRIEVHVTFLLMLAGVALFTASGSGDGAHSAPDYAFALHTVLNLVLLFACVVMHELGHALMAKRYGIRTREIVLLPIGGVARLERMPGKPSQELAVALAGPAVNVVLLAALVVALLALGTPGVMILDRVGGGGTLEFLLGANLVMLLFNLVPAFPMDGGRVLRAGLAMFLPYTRATRYASLVGQGFALLFAIAGIFLLFSPGHSPILLLIALFVFITAGEERALVQTRSSLTGLPVSAAMVTAFVSLETRHELAYAVDLLLAGEQHDFPVLEDGQLLGMLSRDDLLRGMRTEGPDSPVGRLVRLDVGPIESSMPLDAAMQRMSALRQNALPVVARGRLVGLLTLENIRELLLVLEARQRHAGLA